MKKYGVDWIKNDEKDRNFQRRKMDGGCIRMISICIPSYHSLEYLKILIPSIKKNTRIPHEILVHVNGTADGTHRWLEEQSIGFNMTNENKGFCGVNSVLKDAKYPYCMIVNSDMYFLPGWDLAIMAQINQFKKQKIDRFTISSCLIEPAGNNPEFDIFDAGEDAASFDENKLLNWFMKIQPKRENTKQWSHPILIPKFMLEEINYLDESYFPGWNVDNDLPKELYEQGCKNFCLLGNSRVYHFISKTFGKLPVEIKNQSGQNIFLKKWNMTTDEFRTQMKIKQKFEIIL